MQSHEAALLVTIAYIGPTILAGGRPSLVGSGLPVCFKILSRDLLPFCGKPKTEQIPP